MRDLIIVGGGAAGAAAAVYALQNQLDTLVLSEDEGKAGTRQHLADQHRPAYPEGAAIAHDFQQQVVAHDAVWYDRVLVVRQAGDVFAVETQQHGILQCRAVLIATGAAPIPLAVPGAQGFVNHGLGYSATTHAPLCAHKSVAVVGATPRALRGALALARVATQVHLIVPDVESLDAERARILGELPNLSLLRGQRVSAITGTRSVERITIVDTDGEPAWLRVDAIFADLGLLPNSAAVRELVRTDDKGFIAVDERNATSVPGIFAAGDVTTAPCEHSLLAIGQGVRAALSAYDYLLATQLLTTASAR